MKVDCKYAKSCMKQFWQGTLGGFIHDEIVIHIINCDDCFVDYIYSAVADFNYSLSEVLSKMKPAREKIAEEYKEDLELLFEDITEEFKIMACDTLPKTSTSKESITEKLRVIESPDCFMTYFSTYDIQGLLMLRSFKDLCYEFDSEKPLSDDNPKSKFYKFLTKKICQRVDFLEKCYKLDYSGKE